MLSAGGGGGHTHRVSHILVYPIQKVTQCLAAKKSREVPGVDFFFHLETGSISDMMAGDFHRPLQWPFSLRAECRTTQRSAICVPFRCFRGTVSRTKLVLSSVPKQAWLLVSCRLAASHSSLQHVPCYRALLAHSPGALVFGTCPNIRPLEKHVGSLGSGGRFPKVSS